MNRDIKLMSYVEACKIVCFSSCGGGITNYDYEIERKEERREALQTPRQKPKSKNMYMY